MSINDQDESTIIRVTHPLFYRNGKPMFKGVEVDAESLKQVERLEQYSIEIDGELARGCTETLAVGAVCKVQPMSILQKFVNVSGMQIKVLLVRAKMFIPLRPSGHTIISFLAKNTAFKGVGQRKAQALWDKYGEDVYEILDSNCVSKLEVVIPSKVAGRMLEIWQQYRENDELLYCYLDLGLDNLQAAQVSSCYAGHVRESIESDPYRLLAFGVTFAQCDDIARNLGIESDASCRLEAAIEEALNSHSQATGACISKREDLLPFVTRLLMSSNKNGNEKDKRDEAEVLADLAFDLYQPFAYHRIDAETFQSNGHRVMESMVAKSLALRLQPRVASGREGIEEQLGKLQKHQGYEFTKLQVKAIEMALNQPLSIINGGAGVGKTTVLRAIVQLYQHYGCECHVMALSGKAAKRAQESVGISTSTIARFLGNDFSQWSAVALRLVIIDEASMLDLATMYRILTALPESTRILLVGDAHQLPPISPGAVFRDLMAVERVPVTTLTEIKRQSSGSGIIPLSLSVRQGDWTWPAANDCVYRSTKIESDFIDTILQEYRENQAETQIICPTRKLTRIVNLRVSAENTGRQLSAYRSFSGRLVATEFKSGDKVLCTANLYSEGLVNGSMGVITRCFNRPSLVEANGGYGKILWEDGVERVITDAVMDALELGYAITIHKAQGSQFERVIVAIPPTKNLDRAMLYTAITRAKSELVAVEINARLNYVVKRNALDSRNTALCENLLSALVTVA